MLAYGGPVRRLLTAFACLALLTACDDGESIDPEADEERIEDALLELDDLPDGFVEDEAGDDEDSENPCNEEVLDVDPDELDDNKTAETDDALFEDEAAQIEVRAEIEAFRDTDLPQRVLDGIGDDEYRDCLEEELGELLGDAELLEFDEIDSPVDGGRALEILADVGGTEVLLQQHAVLVDRFGVSLQVTALGSEIDDDLVEDALDAMIERLGED
jgi:hypothetical protein